MDKKENELRKTAEEKIEEYIKNTISAYELRKMIERCIERIVLEEHRLQKEEK